MSSKTIHFGQGVYHSHPTWFDCERNNCIGPIENVLFQKTSTAHKSRNVILTLIANFFIPQNLPLQRIPQQQNSTKTSNRGTNHLPYEKKESPLAIAIC